MVDQDLADAWAEVRRLCEREAELLAELRTLRARVAEMERDARLGATVRAEVTRDNTYGPNPALDLEVRAIGAREAGNYAIGYLLRAIADALRAEGGGSDA